MLVLFSSRPIPLINPQVFTLDAVPHRVEPIAVSLEVPSSGAQNGGMYP